MGMTIFGRISEVSWNASIHSIFDHGKVETLCEDGSETFSHFLARKNVLSQKNFFIENHGHFQPKPPLQPFWSLVAGTMMPHVS